MDKSETESVDSIQETQRQIASEINGLPDELQRPFIGLHQIQKEKDELLKQKEKEMLALEQKYHELGIPLLDKMNKLVNGQQDVDDEVVVLYKEKYAAQEKQENIKVNLEELKDAKPKIPNFWLIAMENNEVIKHSIHENDRPALKYLKEINSYLAYECDFKTGKDEDKEGPPADTEVANDASKASGETDEQKQVDESQEEVKDKPDTKGTPVQGFRLSFVFDSNPYFKNQILTKAYKIKNNTIEEGKGTEIEWFDGKNLTEKKIKKKQKNKKTGKQREIIKTEQLESFFTMFKDSEIPAKEIKEGMDQDKQDQIQDKIDEECDVATQIHEILLNSPVEYYFGITGDVDDDMDGFEDMDDQDMPPMPPQGKKKKGKKAAKHANSDDEGGEEGDQKKCANQ